MIVDLIESSSNQRFVFASNKLRESIGASELIFRAGVHWVLDAVADANGNTALRDALGDHGDTAALRDALADPARNPWPGPGAHDAVHVLIATSGKALLLARDEAVARRINRHVTMRVAADAPGLDVCTAFAAVDGDSAAALENAIGRAFHLHDQARRGRPDPLARFAWSPPFAPCGTTGLPASVSTKLGLRSRVAQAKRKTAANWEQRIRTLLRDTAITLPYDLEDLSELEGADWIGLVHADGNGLGKIFRQFGATLASRGLADSYKKAQDYAALYREFSQAVEVCTEGAFLDALRQTRPRKFRGRRSVHGVYPVVLGGDDLTAVVVGREALAFAHDYLAAFETRTRSSAAVTDIAGEDGLTASAGVAIVKPHYPFHSAYDLAEDLTRSAKTVKRINAPLSSIDAHVLYDGTYSDLDAIRRRLTVDGAGTRLYCRPWLVGGGVDAAAQSHGEWVERRRYAALEAGVAALTAVDDDDRRVLPTSQTHRLRLALRSGSGVADATLQTLRHRYDASAWALLAPGDSLFFEDTDPWSTGRPVAATRFLDALEFADFVNAETVP